MQLKTVIFDLTQAEFEKLQTYLADQHGTLLTKANLDVFKTTNGTIIPSEKHRYSGMVPVSFPMGEPEWVIRLQSEG